MNANPFKDWDATKVTEHNQRVAERRVLAKTVASAAELVTGTRVRQSHKKPNKLEAEWGKILLSQYLNYPRPRYNAKTYLIANGLRFTPDWTVSFWPKGTSHSLETAWEVKGPRAWDGALDKLKMAATAWPEVRWILVWKEMGQWQSQEILP